MREFAHSALPYVAILIGLFLIYATVIKALAGKSRTQWADDNQLMNFGRSPNPETSPAHVRQNAANSSACSQLDFVTLAAERVLTGLVVGAAFSEALFFFAPELLG